MNQIYVGWDSRAGIAYEVARSSIWHRTKSPLKVYPLKLQHLGMLTRPIERRGHQLWCPISNAPMSTEFAISRFCVPFLQESGWALFVDCDIICLSDIDELFALADPQYAVMCVKRPNSEMDRMNFCATKMDGQQQTYYSRKNWSSVVLWNLDHPANKRFALDDLNTRPGRELHAFYWLRDEEIGALPYWWNWLVNAENSDEMMPSKGIWHYTLGGPWFNGWKPAPYDDVWLNEKANATILCA